MALSEAEHLLFNLYAMHMVWLLFFPSAKGERPRAFIHPSTEPLHKFRSAYICKVSYENNKMLCIIIAFVYVTCRWPSERHHNIGSSNLWNRITLGRAVTLAEMLAEKQAISRTEECKARRAWLIKKKNFLLSFILEVRKGSVISYHHHVIAW